MLFTEQYELFLKFNHDQLRRKFDAEMSDCSCEKFAVIASCFLLSSHTFTFCCHRESYTKHTSELSTNK